MTEWTTILHILKKFDFGFSLCISPWKAFTCTVCEDVISFASLYKKFISCCGGKLPHLKPPSMPVHVSATESEGRVMVETLCFIT